VRWGDLLAGLDVTTVPQVADNMSDAGGASEAGSVAGHGSEAMLQALPAAAMPGQGGADGGAAGVSQLAQQQRHSSQQRQRPAPPPASPTPAPPRSPAGGARGSSPRGSSSPSRGQSQSQSRSRSPERFVFSDAGTGAATGTATGGTAHSGRATSPGVGERGGKASALRDAAPASTGADPATATATGAGMGAGAGAASAAPAAAHAALPRVASDFEGAGGDVAAWVTAPPRAAAPHPRVFPTAGDAAARPGREPHPKIGVVGAAPVV
jgi:hypothetical protein